MRLFRYVRNGLERMLAMERFAEMGLYEDRRARERARQLLLRCLTPGQRAEFERTGTFKVRGRSGQHYRITYGTTANIEVLAPSGTVCRRLCAGPVGVPIPAMMLAQKLMLETQEAEFVRIAARGPGTTPAAGFPQFSG
ncbi:MAG TPA: hypothetical protein VIQ55_05260 [Burkholderiales bacterium]